MDQVMDISLCKFHGIKILQRFSAKQKSVGGGSAKNAKYGFILSKQAIVRKSSQVQN